MADYGENSIRLAKTDGDWHMSKNLGPGGRGLLRSENLRETSSSANDVNKGSTCEMADDAKKASPLSFRLVRPTKIKFSSRQN